MANRIFSYGNGQNGEAFAGGGIATGAGIYAPYGIAVDQAGNLLVAEYFDHLIRKVSANQATLFFQPELWQNQVSSPQNQSIENDGNATLTFSAVAPDANAAVASSGTTCTTASSIAVDASCVVAAEFAPTSTTLTNPLVGNVNLTGDTANSPLDISVVGQALGLNGAIVTLTSSQNPSAYGQAVTLNVTVKQDPNSTQGTPTGTVTYSDTFQGATTTLGTQTLDGSGNAGLLVSSLAVGTHVIVANYGGDTYYSASASNPLSQVVQEQVTVVVTNIGGGNPSSYGATVIFSATVSVSGGIPVSGAVSFYNGGNYLGSGTLNGNVATYSTATLPVGSNSITASYTDSNNVTGTSSVLKQVVQQNTATALTSSANPVIHGMPVTFTAVVTATGTTAPTGAVTFYDGTTQIGTGTLTASGTTSAVATFQISSLAAGTHSITASYGGDANDFTSTSAALSETVNIATSTTALAASANPSIAGKPLTLTATVATNGGTAAGTVNFYNGATLVGSGTLNSAGVATFTTSTLPVGSYSITANYAGDGNDTGSTSAALALSVIQATTGVKLVASSPSVQVTAPVTFTATVTGNGAVPTGSVTFMDGANTLGSVAVNAGGVAAYTTSSLAVGTHAITAVYGGDANDAGSTSSGSHGDGDCLRDADIAGGFSDQHEHGPGTDPADYDDVDQRRRGDGHDHLYERDHDPGDGDRRRQWSGDVRSQSAGGVLQHHRALQRRRAECAVGIECGYRERVAGDGVHDWAEPDVDEPPDDEIGAADHQPWLAGWLHRQDRAGMRLAALFGFVQLLEQRLHAEQERHSLGHDDGGYQFSAGLRRSGQE